MRRTDTIFTFVSSGDLGYNTTLSAQQNMGIWREAERLDPRVCRFSHNLGAHIDSHPKHETLTQ